MVSTLFAFPSIKWGLLRSVLFGLLLAKSEVLGCKDGHRTVDMVLLVAVLDLADDAEVITVVLAVGLGLPIR